MIILCIGIVLFASVITSKKYPFAEMIIIFCFIVVGLGYIVLTYKDHQNAYQKTVQTQRAGWVEGEVTLSVQVVLNQREPAYQIVVDGKSFQVERSLYTSFEGFIQHMETRPNFRVYFAPEINRILFWKSFLNKSMTTHADVELMRIFDFTVGDLEANRAGRISDQHIRILIAQTRRERWHLIIASFIVPVVLMGVLLGSVPQIEPAHQSLGRITAIGTALFILVFMLFGVIDKESDIQQGKADCVEGMMRVGIDYWLEGRGDYPKIGKYYTLDIALHGTRIRKPIYLQLEQYQRKNGTNQQFRLYYAHHSRRILSLEIAI